MSTERIELIEPRYLGDAVYASFDGYQIWLHIDSHLNPPLVALEPRVMDALVIYQEHITNQIYPTKNHA